MTLSKISHHSGLLTKWVAGCLACKAEGLRQHTPKLQYLNTSPSSLTVWATSLLNDQEDICLASSKQGASRRNLNLPVYLPNQK